jgi:steroid delta-isomerase-like uncharacterized protein
MTRSELEDLTRRWISLWSVPTDWKLFDQIHSEDFEDMSPAGREPSKQALAKGLQELIEAFPDLSTRVEDMIVDETAQRVAVRWSSIGTNRRKFLGVGPTHHQTSITGIEIIEVSNGQITKRWGEWDISGHRT